MKTHTIGFIQPESIWELLFTPKREFKVEWCLDFYGFLSREELDVRMDDINKHIRHLPLMSKVMKQALGWAVLVSSILLVVYIVRAGGGIGAMFGLVLFFVAYFGGLWLIERLAQQRADAFTGALKALFVSYNNSDNPTANWSVTWVTTLVGWKTTSTINATGGGVTSRSKPKFAEQVIIVLDISDALSDRTSENVHVNLAKSLPQTINHAMGMANDINRKNQLHYGGNMVV